MVNGSKLPESKRRTVVQISGPATANLVGFLFIAVSLAHLPGGVPALNSFDPPKRLLWSVFAMAVSLVFLFQRRGRQFIPTWPAVALLVWMAARSLWRDVPLREVQILVTWMLPVLLYVLARALTESWRVPAFDRLGSLLLATAALQGMLMLLQYAGLDPVFSETTSEFTYRPSRMIGTIGYHNQAVDFLCVCAAGVSFRVRDWRFRIIWFGMASFVVLLTGNRGGVLGFFAAILAIWALHFRRELRLGRGLRHIAWLIMLVAVASAGILMVPDIRHRLIEVVTGFDESVAVQSRLWLHRVAWRLWETHPFTGVGAGEYAYRFLPTLAELVPKMKTHEILQNLVFAREAHFDLLQFGAEFGLIGLGLLGWCAWEAVASWRRAREEGSFPKAFSAALWILVYMLVSSLFSFGWQSAAAGPTAGLLLGALTPSVPASTRRLDFKHARRAAIVLFATGVAVFSTSWNYWNIRVPDLLERNEMDRLIRIVPGTFHQFRSVIGAAVSAESEETALRIMEDAEKGYRDVLLWSNRASLHMRRGEWEEAIELYTRWADTGIRHEEALRNLSVAQESAGLYQEAGEILAKRLRLWYPVEPTPIQRLSVLFLQGGAPGKSLHVLDNYYGIWRKFPARDKAILWNLKGAAHLRLAEPEQARRAFETALRHDSTLTSARLNLANLEEGKEDGHVPAARNSAE